ncbi:DUF2637 domain-containing protein [Streptomyces sp. CA-251247]|uniref:DUF2637 domain-containing protein n=1 Tax=Streptomyces sp. CA-251247 TaxID=3240062 RepID=UPI003D8B2C71
MRHDQGTAADPSGSASAPEKLVPRLTRTHRVLIGLVTIGAVVIAAIGFAGSYGAVRELAVQKGFGDFAVVFPIGIDAGICVLLALDLLLTWLRIPFPMLRQTAWLLTVATIAFNGAAAWPDPLGVGMHAVIPVLFVVSVEAARHAVGRIADITADKHMEGVRLTRWLLSPLPTFKLWRRMKLWEVRSYEVAVEMEQARLIYQARLQARYGRSWRRKAPVEAMMPLRLAKYGVPLTQTAPAGLAAAGIPLPVELKRVDEVPPELPAVERTTTPAPVVADVQDHDTQHEVEPDDVTEDRDPLPAAETTPHMEPYAFRPHAQLAGAAGPVAAHNGKRPQMVQARIDSNGTDWFQKDPAPVAEPASPSSAEPQPEASVPAPATEPEAVELTGVDLLEHLYLQLTAEERAQSASALARRLCADVGFTEGTARKYLRPIIEKHS